MLCVRFVFAHMTTYACRSFGLLGTLPRRQATGGGMQYRYTYYDNGRLKEKQASGRTLLAYAYDLSGNITSRRDLTGKETCYGYDRCGRLKSVTDNGRVLAAYTYHGDGRVESRTIADTIRTDFRYDADKNLTHMKTVDLTAQGRKLVWEEYPAYDHNGNMVEKRNLEGTTRYAYDANNQLVEVSYPGAGGLLSERFGYDKAGNRLTRERRTVDSVIMETYCHDNCNRIKELNRRTYEPDGVTQKLKKFPVVSNNPDAVASYIGETSYYGYDRSGNLLNDGNATYTYDGFGRTAEVKMANGNSQINRYDAEGLRAEMEENGQLVQFLFNEEREVIAEETGNDVIRYVRGLGIISSDSESARTYYHYVSDNQGSVRLILTDMANDRRIRNYYCYDAFGESVISHEDIHNRFRFNGEQYDPVTSQYYLRARFYNPVIGRFTQEDTYYGDGLNLYEYCRNNPVLYRDPSGHDVENQKNLYGGGDFYVTPEGVVIPQEYYHSLSDLDARKWYLLQEATIPDLIDYSKSLEQQAYQAFSLRNKFRTAARELMANREVAEMLYKTDPNRTWKEIVQRQVDKGMTGDDIYRAIIQSSQRSRSSVNKSLGLE